MVAPGVGEAAEGSGVARDCSGELRSGRACGGVGASRSAGGERVREGGEISLPNLCNCLHLFCLVDLRMSFLFLYKTH